MAVNYNELQTELAERFGIKELRYLASGDDSDTFLVMTVMSLRYPGVKV